MYQLHLYTLYVYIQNLYTNSYLIQYIIILVFYMFSYNAVCVNISAILKVISIQAINYKRIMLGAVRFLIPTILFLYYGGSFSKSKTLLQHFFQNSLYYHRNN